MPNEMSFILLCEEIKVREHSRDFVIKLMDKRLFHLILHN